MKTFICGIAMASAVMLLPSLASAQTANAGSSSTSGSTSSSAADASAGALAAAQAVGNSGNNHSSFRSPRAPGAIGLPGLAASSGCMGSTTLGASFIGGGLGVGSTWQDQRCNAREDARLLAAFGYREQALQLLIVNSPMVAQVMGAPEGVVVQRRPVSYQPVSLSPDSVNGIRQIYRGPSQGLPEKCSATLALMQQQDSYLKALVTGRQKLTIKVRNAALVQQNLKTGIDNTRALCPGPVIQQVVPEISGRIQQIDSFVSTGKWTGPVG
jgi:hypothetical protein